jgi:hypothetical protein
MIYELRTYTLMPGKQGEYLKLNQEVGRPIRGDKYGKLEGSWTTEFGLLNQYVHLWSYPSLDERERLRGELMKNPDWTQGYVPKIRPMLIAQENKMLAPQLPFTPPARAGTSTSSAGTARTSARRGSGWATSRRSCRPARSTRKTSASGRRKPGSSTRSSTCGPIAISITASKCAGT